MNDGDMDRGYISCGTSHPQGGSPVSPSCVIPSHLLSISQKLRKVGENIFYSIESPSLSHSLPICFFLSFYKCDNYSDNFFVPFRGVICL